MEIFVYQQHRSDVTLFFAYVAFQVSFVVVSIPHMFLQILQVFVLHIWNADINHTLLVANFAANSLVELQYVLIPTYDSRRLLHWLAIMMLLMAIAFLLGCESPRT